MKKVIVNRIKLKCSKGRFEKGETLTLPDDEVARIIAGRPDLITVLGDVSEKKPARKPRNAKSTPLNKD